MQELVCDLDIYGDCQANFDAFLALLAQHQKPVPTTKELKDAFALLDADKSGSISAKELKHYLTSVGDKLSDEEVCPCQRLVPTSPSGRRLCPRIASCFLSILLKCALSRCDPSFS